MKNDPINGFRQNFLQWIPWVVLLGVIAFAWAPHADGSEARALTLSIVILLLALWFIVCFTGDAADNLRHNFVFAYAFTFVSFALLVTPLAEPRGDPSVRPPEGALQLVRGCVGPGPAAADAVSLVTRCPDWIDDKVAAAPSPGASWAAESDRRFSWLISIGGVTVRQFTAYPDTASAKSKDARKPQQNEFVIVYGGLVVPLFVVALAFIGGAVSLSRRIPEYQRKADPRYVSTADDPSLTPLQAREHVVFQIMQLVSAPFLAMATWYVVTPTTLAAAAGLAFGTGFASEPLLLMIRGMVEGLRPAVTVTSKAATPATPTDDEDHDHGHVTNPTADADLPAAQGGVRS